MSFTGGSLLRGSKTRAVGSIAPFFSKNEVYILSIPTENLQELGINRMMKNFTRDYPVKLLQNADADHFIEQIVEICSAPEQFDKIFMQFYDMYEGQIDAGVEAFCKSFGRKKRI